jgi:S-adenosylmethionine-dependent methyltransferase
MTDDLSDIVELYNSSPEGEHNRLVRHQLEYDLTWRYLERYLPERGSILEIGAATGRYTVELARRGYRLTAVDLSANLLALCSQNLADAGLGDRTRLVLADARDLSAVAEREFDAVLLMGPLYHLIQESDRKSALREACDRLRPGGVFFSAWISRFGVLGDVLHRTPDWIENQAGVRSHLARGSRPAGAPRGGFRGYFALAAEVAPAHQALGLETLALAGVDPVIGTDDESYNNLQGEQRRLWLDLFEEIGAEPSIVAASRHLLYIGRKVSFASF